MAAPHLPHENGLARGSHLMKQRIAAFEAHLQTALID
jgi:hypothetical protein